MNPFVHQILSRQGYFCSTAWWPVLLVTVLFAAQTAPGQGADDSAWRPLPLIQDGKVDPAWMHLGWGGFVVDDGALRTECDAKGLGLLVYKKEPLGNCQIRVVFKAKEPQANAGVYVRIHEDILKEEGRPGAAFARDAAGKPSDETLEKMKGTSEREEGPWFAVHRGFEVQIADGGDPYHRTGAIYSLAPSSAVPQKVSTWRTMIITLSGDRIRVDLDGKRVSTFDSGTSKVQPRKEWHEPKREPKRPQVGYLGLQNHDPGDIVWFKEISVRPLPTEAKAP